MAKKKKSKSKKKAPPKPEDAGVSPAESTDVDLAESKDDTPGDDGNNGKQEKDTPSELPAGLEASMSLFSPSQQTLLKLLCSSAVGQSHLFEKWSTTTSDDETDAMKKKFAEQVEELHKSYPSGGLPGYVKNARELLEKSRKGENPLEGWEPTVPKGQAFEIGKKEYDEVEAIGLKELGSVGFVLVAGGLGERLGYGDIKIGLPTEMATETKYLQYYIEYILALQKKYAPKDRRLPLCIMVSGDTNAGTLKLLKEYNNFGMEDDQITIVQQGQGVPALMDNDATIAMETDYKILTKPHGHGDIHALLHSDQVAKKWGEKGIEWMAFFQDTNGLAFHTLPLALGVSAKFDLVMNSLAVPRKAKQAIGGIAKLVNSKGESRTINVEYNQLDPLLRSSGHEDGDVNDPETGYSPFPGNINQLLFKLKPYVATLERTKGAMPEFVNPKYKDAEKSVFKKPTRLECMMQDFPTVLEDKESEKVGFTSIAADLCFSPVKNATADGVALQAKGSPPGVAASGEADQYGAVRAILRSVGCNIDDAPSATFSGITIVPGPQIVFKPNFVVCPAEYKKAFPMPEKVSISPKSSLVVNGTGVVIESLELDGALVIECEEGASGVIRDLSVVNEGWLLSPVESSNNEVIAMRGYVIEKRETRYITFKSDGSIEGDYDPDAAAKAREEAAAKAKAEAEEAAAKAKAEEAKAEEAKAEEAKAEEAKAEEAKAEEAKAEEAKAEEAAAKAKAVEAEARARAEKVVAEAEAEKAAAAAKLKDTPAPAPVKDEPLASAKPPPPAPKAPDEPDQPTTSAPPEDKALFVAEPVFEPTPVTPKAAKDSTGPPSPDNLEDKVQSQVSANCGGCFIL